VAVLESIRIQRIQFEVVGGKTEEGQQASCEIRAHSRAAGEKKAALLLVARFFEGHPSPPFRLELAVEGHFRLEEGETPRVLAEGAGPPTLYPHLRDEVAHITLRAGLPPVVLPPLRLAQPVQIREDVN
jgi:preprotein translocase subunit SecB